VSAARKPEDSRRFNHHLETTIMDLAPIYSTISDGPATILAAHHGQVTVIHKGRPAAHKATLELFELGQQVDLATVVQLAQHLGLAPRDNRALLQVLVEGLEVSTAGCTPPSRTATC
jgi:hypothetical protein